MDNFDVNQVNIPTYTARAAFNKGSGNIESAASKAGIIPELRDCLRADTTAWEALQGMTTYNLMGQFMIGVRGGATSQQNAQAFFTWAVGRAVPAADAQNLTYAIGMFVGPMSRGGDTVFNPDTLE